MAWIRRIRRASGATAVQVADYVNGRRRIVAHVGSAHSEAELRLLMQQTQELLERPGQGEFDLGVAPELVKADLLGPGEGGDEALFAPRDVSGRACGWVDRQVAVCSDGKVVATRPSTVHDPARAGAVRSPPFAEVKAEAGKRSPLAASIRPRLRLKGCRLPSPEWPRN